MKYPKILISPGREHVLSHNHPWIFSRALQTASGINDGQIVDIFSPDGKKFYCRGYYNSKSQIAVRILSRNPDDEINSDFFVKKFNELMEIRKKFIDTEKTNAFRVVFGESDGIPGLIIDKYAEYYVIQIHTLGMDKLREQIVEAMEIAFKPKSIFEKSDVGVRRQEGLADLPVGLLRGQELPAEIKILENGVVLSVNIKEGQKTGFFLDQRENRKALQKYCKGKRVLNCFCYTAAFSVYAALAGAKETVNADISEGALRSAKQNFELNNIPLNLHSFVCEDIFEILPKYVKEKNLFDVVILDPPAFVKNQKNLKKGMSGYLFINDQALKLLPQGGILVSSSCSAHVSDEIFQHMLAMAASKNSCTLKILEIKHQPIDHPYNLHFPEGKYLKFYVMLKG